MKSSIVRLSLILMLVVILAMASTPVAAEATRIPIVNYFLACEFTIERKWDSDGIRHIRGKEITGRVMSESPGNFHAGLAMSWTNANIVLATMHTSSHGKLKMNPDAWQGGWWEGSVSIQGVPSDEHGVARLKGYGTLDGYLTRTTVRHLPPSVLNEKFPGACGPNTPIKGGSVATGYVLLPGGE